MQREQIEITAYHEAGHAVMAMSVGFLVTEISVTHQLTAMDTQPADALPHVGYCQSWGRLDAGIRDGR